MRIIIPKNISDMQAEFAPYMHYVEGQGVVLDSNAPSDIVEKKKIVDKWFEDHKNNI